MSSPHCEHRHMGLPLAKTARSVGDFSCPARRRRPHTGRELAKAVTSLVREAEPPAACSTPHLVQASSSGADWVRGQGLRVRSGTAVCRPHDARPRPHRAIHGRRAVARSTVPTPPPASSGLATIPRRRSTSSGRPSRSARDGDRRPPVSGVVAACPHRDVHGRRLQRRQAARRRLPGGFSPERSPLTSSAHMIQAIGRRCSEEATYRLPQRF